MIKTWVAIEKKNLIVNLCKGHMVHMVIIYTVIKTLTIVLYVLGAYLDTLIEVKLSYSDLFYLFIFCNI